jgi:hypothetical protein
MPVDAPSYARFRAALKAGDVAEAFDVAKRLSGLLSLLDALELTLLAAEKGWDGPFQDCAARWLARVAVEKNLRLDQLARATEVFQEAGRGEGKDVFKSLASYL